MVQFCVASVLRKQKVHAGEEDYYDVTVNISPKFNFTTNMWLKKIPLLLRCGVHLLNDLHNTQTSQSQLSAIMPQHIHIQ